MRCGPVANKTYSLLRYVPTYWGLPSSAIPLLIMLGAVLTALGGIYGVAATVGAGYVLRLAFQWNDAALTVLRVTLQSLALVDRHRRLKF
jgi:hypothetical protein